ncbi:hypothetical protein AB1N83_012607 [Pleurotus pulmonarius]
MISSSAIVSCIIICCEMTRRLIQARFSIALHPRAFDGQQSGESTDQTLVLPTRPDLGPRCLPFVLVK